MDFFSTEFGFTTREVAALMGAHTLGSASIDNSGFQGVWVTNEPAYFNNKYYSNIADSNAGWKARQRTIDGVTSGWQWSATGVGFNISPDMALYKVQRRINFNGVLILF